MKIFSYLLFLIFVLSACGSSPEVTVQDSGEVAELESMMDAPVDEAVEEGYLYENLNYGFTLRFPESMKNFIITPRSEQVSYGEYQSLASYDIGFEDYFLEGSQDQLQAFINVSVYKEADWDAIVKQEEDFISPGKEIARANGYVFTMSHGQDVFPDGIEWSDYEVLEESFRVL